MKKNKNIISITDVVLANGGEHAGKIGTVESTNFATGVAVVNFGLWESNTAVPIKYLKLSKEKPFKLWSKEGMAVLVTVYDAAIADRDKRHNEERRVELDEAKLRLKWENEKLKEELDQLKKTKKK